MSNEEFRATHIVDGQGEHLECPVCRIRAMKFVRLMPGEENCQAECVHGHRFEIMQPIGTDAQPITIRSEVIDLPGIRPKAILEMRLTSDLTV